MKKTNFRADIILNKKFTTEMAGYNAEEVDIFFDKIIDDYKTFEDSISGLEQSLEDKVQIIHDKDEKIKALNIEIFNLKDQLKSTEKATNPEILKELISLKDMLNIKK